MAMGIRLRIVQFGGQTAINLADPLARSGMPVLGTSAECIDLSEDRRRFEQFLGNMGIPQPPAPVLPALKKP